MKRLAHPSTALGFLALFLALAGGASAVVLLPKNSVTTKQVKDHSLMGRDFKRGQLPRGARGPSGTSGVDGAPGAAGPAGAAGPSGIASVTTVDGPPAYQCAAGGGGCQVGGSTATCPAGSIVVGGGFLTDVPDDIVAAARRTGGTTYGVVATNEWSTSGSLRAQAICASGPGAVAAARTLPTVQPKAIRRLVRKMRAALDRRP